MLMSCSLTDRFGVWWLRLLRGQDMYPPKQLNIEVHVLKSYGEIMTPTGTVTLTKGDRLSLRRTDVEHLIRQGVVEETNE